MSEVYTKINIPEFHKQRISVASLEEHSGADKEQCRLLEKTLSNISLLSVLDSKTINIRPLFDDDYSYQTIYVIRATIKTDNNLTEVSKIIHSAFAEPVIIFYQLNNKEFISLAPKRRNKIEKDKSIIETHIFQEIEDNDAQYLNFKKISSENLKGFYEKIYYVVYKIRFKRITSIYPSKMDDNLTKMVDEYGAIQSTINKLKQEYSEASMMNEQIEIDNKIYREERKQIEIIEQLKGKM